MEAIYDVGGELDLAVTLRDDVAAHKAGRVYLDAFCTQHGIPLMKIRNINDPEAVAAIATAQLDWLFIVGWSQIARQPVLRATRNGVLGMHPTLLPIGRGRAPIPWAIVHGLARTGVTLFKLDDGVDTGPIVAQMEIEISARETATTLYATVNAAHETLLKNNWHALITNRLMLTEQDEQRATVWPARRPEDGRLSSTMTVVDADRLIRAVTRPYPGAFVVVGDKRLRIWKAGAPLEDCGGASENSVRRLYFADGWLDATEWTVE